MTPLAAITICCIWLGVGLAGAANNSQPLVAILGLFALFATGVVAGRDEQ